MITHWIHAVPNSLVQRLSFTATGIAYRRLDFSAANVDIGRGITGYKNELLILSGEIIPIESIDEFGCGSLEFIDPSTFNESGPPTLSAVLLINEDMFSCIWSQACAASLMPFTISLDFEPSAGEAQVPFEGKWNVALEPTVSIKEVKISRTVNIVA